MLQLPEWLSTIFLLNTIRNTTRNLFDNDKLHIIHPSERPCIYKNKTDFMSGCFKTPKSVQVCRSAAAADVRLYDQTSHEIRSGIRDKGRIEESTLQHLRFLYFFSPLLYGAGLTNTVRLPFPLSLFLKMEFSAIDLWEVPRSACSSSHTISKKKKLETTPLEPTT